MTPAIPLRQAGLLAPYLPGERTPYLPDATGSVPGLTLDSTTPEHIPRTAIKGPLCGVADAVGAVTPVGPPLRHLLIGGAAQSPAVPQITSVGLGLAVASEYAADGAAGQAAWVLSGAAGPPARSLLARGTVEADTAPHVRQQFAERQLVVHLVAS